MPSNPDAIFSGSVTMPYGFEAMTNAPFSDSSPTGEQIMESMDQLADAARYAQTAFNDFSRVADQIATSPVVEKKKKRKKKIIKEVDKTIYNAHIIIVE